MARAVAIACDAEPVCIIDQSKLRQIAATDAREREWVATVAETLGACESRSLVLHPSGTDSASESVSSAQHRSTARLALSRLAARLARVRQHARIATSGLSPAVAVPLPLAVPIAAGASPAATRCMSLATYARTLVTARTRSVAASSRGRACVRRDAVCGRIDAADIFGAFASLAQPKPKLASPAERLASGFAIQFARPRVCVFCSRVDLCVVAALLQTRASGAATASSGSRPYLVTVSCPRLLFEERCGYSGRVQRPQKALPDCLASVLRPLASSARCS